MTSENRHDTGLVKKMAMRNKKRGYSATLLVLIASAVFLSGCGAPFLGEFGQSGHSREEFGHYVEEVFRFQNSITSEVMMLLEAGEVENRDVLLRSEQNMHRICEPLNEYVSRDIDGLSTGFFLRRKVVKSTMDCDHAAHEVKALLDEQ